MSSTQKYVVIGKFGKTHGLQGWIRVYPFTETVEAMLSYKPWYIAVKEEREELKIDGVHPHGRAIIVHIEAVNDVDAVRYYTDKEIFVLHDQLPKLDNDEYYWSDLKGLTVVNREGVELGVIDHLMETGSNDVLVVLGKKKQHVIPFLREKFVLEIDFDKNIMIVDWDPEF